MPQVGRSTIRFCSTFACAFLVLWLYFQISWWVGGQARHEVSSPSILFMCPDEELLIPVGTVTFRNANHILLDINQVLGSQATLAAFCQANGYTRQLLAGRQLPAYHGNLCDM